MPVVYIYALCYNEAPILPFVIDYWKRYAARAVVYDNGSDDASLDILSQYDWIEVRHFDSDKFDDSVNQHIKNECWKEARGKADFVQVSDMDEVLWSDTMQDELEKFKQSDAAVWNPHYYDLVTENFPEYDGILLHDIDGVRGWFNNTGKRILFKPDVIKDVNYSVGAHTMNPVSVDGSTVSYFGDENINEFHLKQLGYDYTVNKYKSLHDRLSDVNKRNGWGFHYNFSEDHVKSILKDMYDNGVEIKSKKI